MVVDGTARVLAIIGSGETTPTMAKVHRDLFEKLGRWLQLAVILDTPYGFQSNADDISPRAAAYFRESTGQHVEIVSLRNVAEASSLEVESAQARVGEAQWVFSGPGSPTYALAQWRQTRLPGLFAEKLATGGAIVFSSAAALTLGRWTLPVYEIYKAGAKPAWDTGLDLLSSFGLEVAVIPHYDNAEGGTHDTRYCYLGEGRLRAMEAQLPEQAWVLGVDEHTACIIDLDAGLVSVLGLGAITVRSHGESATVPAGKTVSIDDLRALAAGEAGQARRLAPERAPDAAAVEDAPNRPPPGTGARSPLIAEVSRLSTTFDDALARRDAPGASEAVLELEEALHAWSADTFESDELDRARNALRRAMLRLGEAAGPGLRDPRQVAAPWVEALLTERDEARRSRRFEDADRIRDHLERAGVEVRDMPAGTEWDLRPRPPGAP